MNLKVIMCLLSFSDELTTYPSSGLLKQFATAHVQLSGGVILRLCSSRTDSQEG